MGVIKTKENSDMANIQWHLAYFGVSKLEFKRYRKDLSFRREAHLTEDSLRMDMLVIKKNPSAEIKNEIGRLFRQHNIWEFKGYKDSLNIDSYYKTVGYACIYKGQSERVNDIPKEEVTVSFLRYSYPRDLFKKLEGYGVKIEKKYPGVYYLSGNVMFDTQVIVTKELDSKKHPVLKVITKNAREEDVRKFLNDTKSIKDAEELKEVNAVLQVSMAANEKLYDEIIRRDDDMTQAAKRIMGDVIAEERAEAAANTKLVDIKKLMKTMKWTAKQAMQALEIPDTDQPKYSAML